MNRRNFLRAAVALPIAALPVPALLVPDDKKALRKLLAARMAELNAAMSAQMVRAMDASWRACVTSFPKPDYILTSDTAYKTTPEKFYEQN